MLHDRYECGLRLPLSPVWDAAATSLGGMAHIDCNGYPTRGVVAVHKRLEVRHTGIVAKSPAPNEQAPPGCPVHLRLLVGGLVVEAAISAPAEFLEAVTDAFADITRPGTSDTAAPIAVEVTTDQRMDGRPLFQIQIEDIPRWRTDSANAAVDHIVTSLTRTVLERTKGRLHLHGGLVSTGSGSNGSGSVLLSGTSGAGKSTMVAAALRSGSYAYATDEMVALDLAGPQVFGLLKPLTLKRSSWDLHTDLLGPTPEHGERWAVRASRLGSIAASGPHRVDLIVFPRFVAGSDTVLNPVHPAAAVVRLVSETLDMERAGTQAFHRLVALCRNASAVEVVYGDAADAVVKLGDFQSNVSKFRSNDSDTETHRGHAPVADSDLGSARAEPPGTSYHRRSPSTEWASIDGRTVLYEPTSGTAVELDEVASLWWLALDGHRPIEAIAQTFASVSGEAVGDVAVAGDLLVEQLTEMGVVR